MTIFGDDRSGLTINARIAARTPAEHRAQEGLGTRCLPWDELDAPVRSLAWWTEVVGEVTLAVRNAPPVPRPSRSEDDLELAAFDDLIDQLDRTITQSALAVLGTHPAKHVSRELGSEAAMLAALKFAALAAYTGQVGLTDAQDELRMAMGEVMPRLSLVCTTYAKVLCLRVGRLRGRSLTQPPAAHEFKLGRRDNSGEARILLITSRGWINAGCKEFRAGGVFIQCPSSISRVSQRGQ